MFKSKMEGFKTPVIYYLCVFIQTETTERAFWTLKVASEWVAWETQIIPDILKTEAGVTSVQTQQSI